jgi:hypothetical protein
MKNHPLSIKKGPIENLGNPNDDGCVLGTAGRDEDPNKTTDWKRKTDSAGNLQSPDDAHGMPGYPRESLDDQSDTAIKSTPQNHPTEPCKETTGNA